ncbi:hypothetical protein [Peribacillus simplex]|uniref:hypothetical protein n=1 Tax=Peribacillus simplex TaxID=1478 RepID=UPI0028530B1C|nr:hypothetical protein [Peribacillus simplex]MDR4924721.1 hypothetical protein [Peribacillus simplex]
MTEKGGGHSENMNPPQQVSVQLFGKIIDDIKKPAESTAGSNCRQIRRKRVCLQFFSLKNVPVDFRNPPPFR